MISKVYLIAIFFIFLFGCKNNSSENSENIAIQLDSVNATDEINADNSEISVIQASEDEKLSVDKKCVIFFMPTDKEINKIYEKYGQSSRYDLQEIFTKFKSFAVSSRKILKDENIYSDLTTAYFIEIKTTTQVKIVNRKETSDLVGQIFYNGKDEPIIKYGLMKNKDFALIVKDYFKLDNYKNAEVDSAENSNIIEIVDGV